MPEINVLRVLWIAKTWLDHLGLSLGFCLHDQVHKKSQEFGGKVIFKAEILFGVKPV